jgi:(p)ppGpp synthase/HD superfamily hydrolase
MNLVVEAVKLASELHSGQQKKQPLASQTPYLGHLMEVAGIVLANGGDEITVAAAFLHDAIEDQGSQTRQIIRDQLGEQVLEIVEACTESDTFPKPSWQERKHTYVKQVEAASARALLVIVADKLQNSKVLLRRLKLQGPKGWGKPGREEKLWFKHSLLHAMRARLSQLEPQMAEHPLLLNIHLLIDEYAEVVEALASY